MSGFSIKAARAVLALAWITLASLFLAGCSGRPRVNTAPPPPRIVTVDRVVAETCVKAGDVPSAPTSIGAQINGDAVHDTRVLAAALLAAEAWQGQTKALLGACTGPETASHK